MRCRTVRERKSTVSGVGQQLQMWKAAGRAAQSSAVSVWTRGGGGGAGMGGVYQPLIGARSLTLE